MKTSREIHLRVGSKREGNGGFAFCARMRPNPRESSQARILIECSACIINCDIETNTNVNRERERDKIKKRKERKKKIIDGCVFFCVIKWFCTS
jgi:hypothetical protein